LVRKLTPAAADSNWMRHEMNKMANEVLKRLYQFCIEVFYLNQMSHFFSD
jgi:hypothetical protein